MSALNFRSVIFDCRKSQSLSTQPIRSSLKGVTIFRLRLVHLFRIDNIFVLTFPISFTPTYQFWPARCAFMCFSKINILPIKIFVFSSKTLWFYLYISVKIISGRKIIKTMVSFYFYICIDSYFEENR